MKTLSFSRTTAAVVPLTIVCLVLLLSASSVAQEAGGRRCSNRSISGDYGGDVRGVLLPAPGLSVEFRGLTMTHFDGKGNLTWVEHTVVGGNVVNPGWVLATGTYTVNPDCTGSAVVNTPNSPVPLDLALIVVREGKEVHTVLDSNALMTVFVRVD